MGNAASLRKTEREIHGGRIHSNVIQPSPQGYLLLSDGITLATGQVSLHGAFY